MSTVPEPIASSSRPQRSTRTTASYASSPLDDTASPSPPSRSAPISTRSRRSFSSSLSHPERSPDKRSNSSRESRRGKERSPIKGAGPPDDAALGLILGDATSSSGDAANESVQLNEEGEEEVAEGDGEIEILDDAELELASIDSHKDSDYTPTRNRMISPDKAKLTESNKKVIRLIFGKKRKADEEGDNADESEKEDDPLEQEEPTGIEAEVPAIEKFQSQKTARAVEGARGDAPRRMPRKKRKWLKKGEVDPDDPVAVARQKERHRMIDEAIESLDKQEEMLLASSHPQLMWLWDELERRKDIQLTWLDARHDATIGDLEKLRDHEKKVTMANFKVKREELAVNMVADNRHAMERIFAERTMLKRNPANRPNLRGGRGAGGWPIAATDLLSNGGLRTIDIEVDSELRSRRDISRDIKPLEYTEIQSDLAKLGLPRDPSRTRSASPRASRHTSASHHRTADGRKSTAHSRQQDPVVAALPTKQPSAQFHPPSAWETATAPRPLSKPAVARAPTPESRPVPFPAERAAYNQSRHETPDTAQDHRQHPSQSHNVSNRRDRLPGVASVKPLPHPSGRSDPVEYHLQSSMVFPGATFGSRQPILGSDQLPSFYRPHPRGAPVPPLGVPPQA
ncbi:hypothetical protein I317_01319 [Kwoniella heveanensis CBS 569]|uniref:Uncharacterized protein n=1 Tax=Kwoniella heveanensis BCC8398 TaxID=1296120 RepID=A0A1B9GS61_9TREE|nr:hypothetical protein I316_04539 [Kwoniella heveanensis BCC8398]OCF44830.1 hypothetical protein I317_01319 [Kwoniella heveanensis CBS 569]